MSQGSMTSTTLSADRCTNHQKGNTLQHHTDNTLTERERVCVCVCLCVCVCVCVCVCERCVCVCWQEDAL